MFKNFPAPALATLFGAALLAATPVSAAPISSQACGQAQPGNQIAVRAVAISQGETITLFQTLDGTFQGQGTIEVFCKAPDGSSLGEISDAQVKITVNANDGYNSNMFQVSALNGVGVTDVSSSRPGNPVLIGPFTGRATFLISSPSSLLEAGISADDVATDIQVVTQAWGAPLTDPATGVTLRPGTFGDILAQTPELDSLALFATGAAGMAGYGLTRLRAMRRRDS
jgi:hypothetical protein